MKSAFIPQALRPKVPRIANLQCSALALLLFTQSPPVRADMDSGVRLEIGGESCATAQEMERKIAERSERILFSHATNARMLRIEFVRLAGDSVLGRLSLERDSGVPRTRELRAPTCAEAADALALVAAVTLDPTLALSNHDDTAGAAEARDSAPPAPATPPVPAASSDVPRRAPTRTVPASIPTTPRWRFSAGGAFAAAWGPAPEVLPGASLNFGVEWRTGSFVAPAARLSALRVWSGELATTHGSAEFALLGAILEICPAALAMGPLELRPCGMVTGGVLTAEGLRTEGARSERRPWATLGGSGLLEAHLTRTLALSANASLGRTLVRDSFQFSPQVFHRVPSVAFHAAVGAAVRFP